MWLQPAAVASPDGHLVTLPSGQSAEEWTEPEATFIWLHGVEIETGTGPDPVVARTILDSITYQPGLADTAAVGACTLVRMTTMPVPERLARPISLESGTTMLSPPLPSDQPGVPASSVWRGPDREPSLEHYRMLLVRYTSATPASPNGHGGYTPEFVNRLVWVVYSTSATPGATGCGGTGTDVSDAKTGERLVSTYEG